SSSTWPMLRRWRSAWRWLMFVAALVAPGCKRAALPPRPDGAAVVLAPLAAPGEGDVAFIAEAEPNDTLVAAQRLDLAGAPARAARRWPSPPWRWRRATAACASGPPVLARQLRARAPIGSRRACPSSRRARRQRRTARRRWLGRWPLTAKPSVSTAGAVTR